MTGSLMMNYILSLEINTNGERYMCIINYLNIQENKITPEKCEHRDFCYSVNHK